MNNKKPEWVVYTCFLLFFITVSYFHEPWFDEAQAWMIARDASLNEILFVLPHYECHPPIWHLLLLIPAKLGVPFELGLKTVGFLISAASAGLLIFRTKLPRPVRLLLPFNYFFFYQYGVVTRPYGLMLLIFILLGQVFPERNMRPWRTVLLMTLLCMTSAYGIVIAGGIAIGMVWELWREKGTKRALSELFRGPCSQSLSALLGIALLLIIQIKPQPNTYVSSFPERNPFLLCLIVSLLTFLADCLLTSASWFKSDVLLLQTTYLDPTELVSLCFIGMLLWIFLICASSRKNLKYILIPHTLFAVFSAWVYFAGHHIGVIFMLLLFWWEVLAQDEDRDRVIRAVRDFYGV